MAQATKLMGLAKTIKNLDDQESYIDLQAAIKNMVDFEHRVHGTENLYVVDGASVPSSLGVNPQVTIMAMALRAGALLDARL